ncbi:MAG TPA: hypothetical protein PK095_08120, partial [Myxococcota bacterium]|nr:hypothetical protein [Myxococcota bacterium]
EVRWWTFAGGRINATLRYALEAVGAAGGEWKVVADNFLLRVKGDGLEEASFRRALGAMRELSLWQDEALWSEVADALPNYRLSKFQPLMPPWIQREVVARYLLDVGGAWRWLSGEASGLQRVPEVVRR